MLHAVLKASDIYVHSTDSDGFGIAACEAMAAGLPVVASDVPGLAQLVAGAGILFPPGDDKVLARHTNGFDRIARASTRDEPGKCSPGEAIQH